MPTYQRAYSWDTDLIDKSQKQVNALLSDLHNFVNSESDTTYKMGHFIFEKIEEYREEYGIIDGQQRLTTSVIFLSTLYRRLLQLRGLQSVEDLGRDLCATYRFTIKDGNQYRFSMVDYDNLMFRDYVIDQASHNRCDVDPLSKERIADGYDYFVAKFAGMEEEQLLDLHRVLTYATCTTCSMGAI